MPISLLIPASINLCRSFTNNTALYRAKTLSNLWSVRLFSYVSIFSIIGLSSVKFDKNNQYDLHYRPEMYPIMGK